MNSVYLKRLSEAKPSFGILRFDIRFSAVRCSFRVKFYTSVRVPVIKNSGLSGLGLATLITNQLLTAKDPLPIQALRSMFCGTLAQCQPGRTPDRSG